MDQVDDSYGVGGDVVNFGINDQNNVKVVVNFGSFSSIINLGAVVSGKVVYSTDLGSVNGVLNVAVNIDSISNGAYLVNINVNGSTLTQKLIVRK